jgi:hypothetical protein
MKHKKLTIFALAYISFVPSQSFTGHPDIDIEHYQKYYAQEILNLSSTYEALKVLRNQTVSAREDIASDTEEITSALETELREICHSQNVDRIEPYLQPAYNAIQTDEIEKDLKNFQGPALCKLLKLYKKIIKTVKKSLDTRVTPAPQSASVLARITARIWHTPESPQPLSSQIHRIITAHSIGGLSPEALWHIPVTEYVSSAKKIAESMSTDLLQKLKETDTVLDEIKQIANKTQSFDEAKLANSQEAWKLKNTQEWWHQNIETLNKFLKNHEIEEAYHHTNPEIHPFSQCITYLSPRDIKTLFTSQNNILRRVIDRFNAQIDFLALILEQLRSAPHLNCQDSTALIDRLSTCIANNKNYLREMQLGRTMEELCKKENALARFLP